MPRPAPLCVGEKNAAAMLDMKPAEFRRLVEGGALPGPIPVGELERWSVASLEAILNGDAMDDEDFEA